MKNKLTAKMYACVCTRVVGNIKCWYFLFFL